MDTKRMNNKKTSRKKNTKIVSFVSPLYGYITSISAEEKCIFYDEAYKLYMDRLERYDHERYVLVKETDKILSDNCLWTLRFIFQRIVPTLCDNEPIVFLRNALNEAEHYEYDSICVFLQIAGFRWALIEKSYKRNLNQSRPAREGNKLWNKKEGKTIISLFQKMKETNEKKFIIGYRNVLVPGFIENWENYFSDFLKTIQKERPRLKKEITQIRVHHNLKDGNDIKMLIRNKDIQSYYRNRYNAWYKDQTEEKVFFNSANQFFRLSELEETIWQELSPWLIERAKKTFYTTETKFAKMSKSTIDYLINQYLFGGLSDEKKGLLRTEIVEKKENKTSKRNKKLLTPEEQVQFYEDIYRLCLALLCEGSRALVLMIQETERFLSAIPGMGMILYMFKRIAPTLKDDKPICFLQDAIKQVVYFNKFSWLCVFMQIASFRWGRIENKYINTLVYKHGQSEHKWIDSEEGQFVAPFFEEIRERSDGVYDDEQFNMSYKQTIIPELVNQWAILEKSLKVIASRHPELKGKIDAIFIAHISKETEQAAKITSEEIEPLKRHFRKIYKSILDPKKNDRVIFFGSIRKFDLLSNIRDVLLCKLEPWNIQELVSYDHGSDYKEIISILKESIALCNAKDLTKDITPILSKES